MTGDRSSKKFGADVLKKYNEARVAIIAVKLGIGRIYKTVDGKKYTAAKRGKEVEFERLKKAINEGVL